MLKIIFFICVLSFFSNITFSQQTTPFYTDEIIPRKTVTLDYRASGIQEISVKNPDGSIFYPGTANGFVRCLIEPYNFNDTWGLLADLNFIDATHRSGIYLLAGVSNKTELSPNASLKIIFSTGFCYTDYIYNSDDPTDTNIVPSTRGLGFGLEMRFVKKWQNGRDFILELASKSNGYQFWYSARTHFQIFPILGLGLRAQKNLMIGPYLQLGHDDTLLFWAGYGFYSESFRMSAISAGGMIAFPIKGW